MSMRIDVSRDAIISFCKKWQIVEFAVFGSVVRDDFRPSSDVDVLVRFAPDAAHTLFHLIQMEDELRAVFGRDVDLVTRPAIENSRNYLRRRAILSEAEVIYAT